LRSLGRAGGRQLTDETERHRDGRTERDRDAT